MAVQQCSLAQALALLGEYLVIDTFFFCNKESLLNQEQWNQTIKEYGFNMQLESEDFTLSEEPIFIAATFEGLESGFDLSLRPYDRQDWNLEDEDLDLISKFDSVLTFSTYSNAQEIAGMLGAISSLATKTGSYIGDDFFSGEIVEPAKAIEWAQDILPGTRNQFDGPSTIRTELG